MTKALFLMAASKIFPERQGLNKIGRLRYRMAKEACGMALGLSLLTGYGLLLAHWLSGMEADKNRLNMQVNNITAEATQLAARLTKAEKSLPFFKALTAKYPGGEVILDRQQTGEMMNGLKEQFGLASLRVGIAPIKEKDARFRNASMNGLECEITLSTDALSDEHVMDMLHYLRDALPGGLLRVESATMNRVSDVNEAALRSYVVSGKMVLSHAEIKLLWQGLRMPPKPAAPAPTPARAP